MGLLASKKTVKAYLVSCYEVSEEEATRLVEKHAALVEGAERIGSFAYYPGDAIAEAESLTLKEQTEETEDDE